MAEVLHLGSVSVDVVRKSIKNVHLSVHPPSGRVRISAPLRLSAATIRVFAISKLGWIKKHQANIREQERETPREFVSRESHYVWGSRYLLRIEETDAATSVQLKHRTLVLHVRPRTDAATRAAILAYWHRGLLKESIPALIAKWEPRLAVKVERFFIQQMKTKWGSCNPRARTIRLNTELSKKPRECLEYVVVHELVHLLEPTHNARFKALMDRALPHWRDTRELLNRLPARHEHWSY